MKYAKYISETKIDTTIPKSGRDAQGRLVTGGLTNRPDVLALLDYYPLVEEEMPSEQLVGHHYEKRYYPPNENNEIVQHWISVEDPPASPRSLSKVKLFRKFRSIGLWDHVKEWMQSQEGVWEEWEYSTTLDEDNELVKGAKDALKSSFGLTDEVVEQIVAESVV